MCLEVPGVPIFSLAGQAPLQLWASWGWCTFSEHFFVGTREVGFEALFGVDPLNIGMRDDLELSGPRPAIGHLIEFRGGGIENVPMWRGSERHPFCTVTRKSIEHLVEGAPAAPFFCLAVRSELGSCPFRQNRL